MGPGRSGTLLERSTRLFGAHHVERISPDVTCLVHGNILHGAQDNRAERRREPLTYYHRAGPCGEIFAAVAGRIPGGRVAAVGLGTGSIAAYGAPGEQWTFFEIDAAIERTARSHFTFLSDSAASVDVRIGDGRLLIAKARDGEFGVIVLDAFNSDAVPVHLLTREALAIYLAKRGCRPRGALEAGAEAVAGGDSGDEERIEVARDGARRAGFGRAVVGPPRSTPRRASLDGRSLEPAGRAEVLPLTGA